MTVINRPAALDRLLDHVAANLPDPGLDKVLAEVRAERARQDAKFGEQNHPDGTGYPGSEGHADYWRQRCQTAFADDAGTWGHVLLEEVFEALAEADPAQLRTELVQVAAVAAAWAEAIDRRTAPTEAPRTPTPDPIAYGPTGYRCGCGKDAHSTLTPCQPMTADEWNARYPVGTPVLAYPGSRDDAPLKTTTRTPAWTLGHGAAVVSVEGEAGGICLTHVDPTA